MRLNLTLTRPVASAADADGEAVESSTGQAASGKDGPERLDGLFHFYRRSPDSAGTSTAPRPPAQLPRSTRNGCRCLDRWQYNGHVFTGGQCGRPDNSRSSWCFVVEGSCGGVPVGDNWDECSALPAAATAATMSNAGSDGAAPQMRAAADQFTQQFLELLQSAPSSDGSFTPTNFQAMFGAGASEEVGSSVAGATMVVMFDEDGNAVLQAGNEDMSEDLMKFLQQQMAMNLEEEDK